MKDWKDLLSQVFGLSSNHSDIFLASFGALAVFFIVVLPFLVLIAFVDRKITASLQARIGPSLAGPKGVLQQAADFLKLVQKESGDRIRFREDFWLAVLSLGLFSTVILLPLGTFWMVVNTEMTVFIPFWILSVLSFGTLLLGIEQGNLAGFFGGIRAAGQALSAMLPAMLSVLVVGLRAGGYSWDKIAASQGALPNQWAIFSDPFQTLSFIIFICCGAILQGYQPLEGSSHSLELRGGVMAKLHGARLSLFRVKALYGMFFWSLLAVVYFCGAWNIPRAMTHMLLDMGKEEIIAVLELVAVLAKTFILIIVIQWISVVNPKVRSDQISDFSLRVLGPLSLIALAGSTLWLFGKVAL